MVTTPAQAGATNPGIARLEDPGTDFPYYNGLPVALSAGQWLFVLAMVVLGFLTLDWPIPWPGGAFGPFIPALLMPALPLAALAWVSRGHGTILFGGLGFRAFRLMVGFAVLNIVVSMSVGAMVGALTEVTPNRAAAHLADMDTAGRVAFFAKTIPQLLGEEVITVLPFLALMTWLTRSAGVGRQGAIVGAWLITSVMFGLIHLPTYNWNLIQCIVVIGAARMVLTLPWIMTKNLWVSTGAHIINDWLLFGMSLAGAAALTTG